MKQKGEVSPWPELSGRRPDLFQDAGKHSARGIRHARHHTRLAAGSGGAVCHVSYTHVEASTCGCWVLGCVGRPELPQVISICLTKNALFRTDTPRLQSDPRTCPRSEVGGSLAWGHSGGGGHGVWGVSGDWGCVCVEGGPERGAPDRVC